MSDIKDPSIIEKLSSVPAAFSNIAEKINEIIELNLPLRAGTGVIITDSPLGRLISFNLSATSGLYSSLLAASRTFFVSPSGATQCVISAGTINNVLYSSGTLTELSDGNKIYIDATVDAVTGTVTALTVSKDSSVPSSTTTHAYTLLASVAVTSGIAAITPLAWNYSQLQRCGTNSTYLWGGFGA